MSGRLVLINQFWSGDRETAMRNARRIADNEPHFRDDVVFCFAARFDCPQDEETVAYVGKKFQTNTCTGARRGTGWPGGCNDLWADVVCRHVPQMFRRGGWADVKAVLTFEADAVPVVPDWIQQLSDEWDVAAKLGKSVVGCLMPGPRYGPKGHINGNALFAPDLFFKLPVIAGCGPKIGWDWAHGEAMEPHRYPTTLITNYYMSREVPDDEIERVAPDGRRPVLVHGAKDRSVEGYADRKLRKCPTG